MIFFRTKDRSRIRKGILLINFGTPASPSPDAVQDFLLELFDDQHLVSSRLVQQLLVRACILPFHTARASAQYRAIWTDEGSPFMVQSTKFATRLASSVPDDTAVALGMQYGKPSLAEAVEELTALGVEEMVILPLFPHQVASITRSIVTSLFQLLLKQTSLPRIQYISEFYKEPWFIQAWAQRLTQARHTTYDLTLFSFHAIPERSSFSSSYKDRCLSTAQAIASEAGIAPDQFTLSFQSKVGYGSWTSPETRDVLHDLVQEGKKRVLVICPSFVVDCVETLGEIAGDIRADFLSQGGDYLGLVESLNDSDLFVEGVSSLLKDYCSPVKYVMDVHENIRMVQAFSS